MKKVYIIDDDKNIVESLSIVLEKEGYKVDSQNDEDNVVENINKFDPDLIILDVMFPEDVGSGFKIARTIKKEKTLCRKPIIMLSAINEKSIYAGKFRNRDIDDSWLPVNEFIEKPINPTKLVEKIKAWNV